MFVFPVEDFVCCSASSPIERGVAERVCVIFSSLPSLRTVDAGKGDGYFRSGLSLCFACKTAISSTLRWTELDRNICFHMMFLYLFLAAAAVLLQPEAQFTVGALTTATGKRPFGANLPVLSECLNVYLDSLRTFFACTRATSKTMQCRTVQILADIVMVARPVSITSFSQSPFPTRVLFDLLPKPR